LKISNSSLFLASSSPRRAELLRSAGIDFEIRPADVDERLLDGETAAIYVQRLAAAKALAVAAGCGELKRPVLGADTAVVVDSHILGKPADDDDARRMLRLLSGRTHQVLTGVTLLTAAAARHDRVESTTVEFASMSAREIDWYVSTGECRDKAGAYAIQGLGSRFVRSIDGSYSNVVGLPVAMVYQLCTAAGILIF
jgi:septum formation protein